jgi:uncharacterized alkaline shock family protein YloU
MAALRRVLLALWGLICAGVAALLAIMLVNTSWAESIIHFLDKVALYNMKLSFLEDSGIWMVILFALALLVIGIVCLIVALKPKPTVKKLRVAVVDGGAVDISLAAIQNVIKKAAVSQAGVESVNTRLLIKNNGLHVLLNITIPDNLSVLETGNAVRDAVKAQLEAMAGIVPAEVKVIITDVLEKKEEDKSGGNG